jgi:hypothetical protein
VNAEGAPTIAELLAEWDQAMADPPDYGGDSHEPVFVAQPIPEPPRGRLSFAPPPPAFEPTFHDRVEPLLQPLRARVEAAETAFYERQLMLEQEHEAKMAEAEEALSMRNDIERAVMALNNVSTAPSPDYELPSPETMFNMHPQEFEKVVADYRRRRNR